MDAADSTLMVRFYKKEVELPYRSEQEGRTVHQMMDFCRIEVPGDRLNVIDTLADRGHKKRFPQQWAAFESEQNTDHIEGTLLTQVPFLTSAAAMDLRHYKFYTVEQGAAASDAQLASIAASIGMSGYAFRDKCKAYIEQAKDSSYALRQAEANRVQSEELEILRKQVAELMARGSKPAEVETKRGPGRPSKQEATA
jgi:hypothetical protein